MGEKVREEKKRKKYKRKSFDEPDVGHSIKTFYMGKVVTAEKLAGTKN